VTARALEASVLILVLLASSASVGLALNPTDDDAGSGHDAGDIPETAVAIEPGSHRGRLTESVDSSDHYVFQAQAGQVLRFELLARNVSAVLIAPGGDTKPSGLGMERLLIHETGEWILRFQAPLVDGSDPTPMQHRYRFSFDLSTPGSATYRSSFPGSMVVEASWEDSRRFSLHETVCFDAPAGSSFQAGGYLLRANLTFADGGYLRLITASFSSSAGPGRTVVLQEERHRVPSSVETGIDRPRGTSCAGSGLIGTAASGTIRGVVYTTHEDRGSHLTFEANGSVELREAGGETVTWNGRTGESTLSAQAPGLQVADDRSKRIDLPDPFFGLFDTDGVPGSAEAPNGDRYPLGSDRSSVSLIQVPGGGWRFQVDASASLVTSDDAYLHGAPAPRLGLVEPISGVVPGGECQGGDCLLTRPLPT
jgi:hypothetical protein